MPAQSSLQEFETGGVEGGVRQKDGQHQAVKPKQKAGWDQSKGSETANVRYKIKRSMREKEKAADKAARESKRERQGEAVNSLPWLC